MEETSEVELRVSGYVSVIEHERGWDEGGSKLTDEASNAREMVCWARVMIGIVAEFCGTQRVGRKEREALVDF